MKRNNICVAALCFTLAACATTVPTVSPTARSELAPGGKIRVGILANNPLYVNQSSVGGEMKGLVPDIANELARQLGAQVQPVNYPTATGLLDGAKRNEWEVAFIGYSPERSADMDFTPVMLNGENSYVVRSDSPLRSVADVDRAGIRIATSDRTVQHRHLTQNIRNATVVPVATGAAGMQALVAGQVDAVAGNRMTVTEAAAATPGMRVLEGSFMQVPYSIAIAKGKPAGTAYMTQFVQYLKESGRLDDSIRRANIRGVTVAPSKGY